MKKKKANQLLFLEKKGPWTNNPNPIWLGSLLSLQRNVKQYPFPNKLDTERRKQLVSLISNTFCTKYVKDHPHTIRAEEMEPLEKEFLVEHFLTSQSFLHTHTGEAFLLTEKGDFLATVNLSDHLQIQFIDCQGNLEETLGKLIHIETDLGKSLHWSYSTKYGFLTSNAHECGTAFFCQTFIQIPGLGYKDELDSLIEEYEHKNITFTGLQGNPEELIGDLLVLRNTQSIGVAEETILSQVRTATTKIAMNEERVRKKMAEEGDPWMKDHVSRAYGILSHSYQVDAIEALNSLSLLKLGVDVGWVVGIDMSTLNDLFFRCRRAHLLSELSEVPKKEEVPHKRAELIHEALKKVKLHI